MSGLLKLNWSDFLKGGIMAVIGAALTVVEQFIAAGGSVLSVNWKTVGTVATGALVTYLVKNLLTNSSGEVVGIAATAPK